MHTNNADRLTKNSKAKELRFVFSKNGCL